MTTKPDPQVVVRALELASKLQCTNDARIEGICVPCMAKQFLPLARSLIKEHAELVEAKAALEWLAGYILTQIIMQKIHIDNCALIVPEFIIAESDCPAIIKRYLSIPQPPEPPKQEGL